MFLLGGSCWVCPIADEPVGDVDVVGDVFRGGFLLE